MDRNYYIKYLLTYNDYDIEYNHILETIAFSDYMVVKNNCNYSKDLAHSCMYILFSYYSDFGTIKFKNSHIIKQNSMIILQKNNYLINVYDRDLIKYYDLIKIFLNGKLMLRNSTWNNYNYKILTNLSNCNPIAIIIGTIILQKNNKLITNDTIKKNRINKIYNNVKKLSILILGYMYNRGYYKYNIIDILKNFAKELKISAKNNV